MKKDNLDILNPDAIEDKQKLFTKGGKTTFKNFQFLNSKTEVDDFLFFLNLLLPSEVLLKFYSTEDLKQALRDDLVQKHNELLKWIKTKHYWIDTGEDFEKSDEFLRDFFNYNYSLSTFRRKLNNIQFHSEEISKYHSRMLELDKEMNEK